MVILACNETVYPTDQQTYFFTAQLHVARADTAAAIGALERGLEHIPNNAFFPQFIERLRGGRPNP